MKQTKSKNVPNLDKINILCPSSDKVAYFKSTSVQQRPIGFWMGKQPPLWTHFTWICRVLSSIQLFKKTFSQNTPLTLGSRSISLHRLSCQFFEKSLKCPKLSSCLLLLFFTKNQPSFHCFPQFQRINFMTSFFIIPKLFPLWSQVSFFRVPLELNLLKIASFVLFFFLLKKKTQH